MKVSEDRFPLLFFYLEGQEEEEEDLDARTRTVTRGAAEIIGRWPQYLTFASYMSLVGLLSLVACFVLSVLVLSVTTSGGRNPKRFSIAECRGGDRGAIELSRLRLFEEEIDGGNATFFVGSGSEAVACAVESYLAWTRRPVYYVHLESPAAGSSSANLSLVRELESKFDNYKTVVVAADAFLRGVAGLDAVARSPAWLSFLVRVVILWNFGGTVIDADVVTLANYGDLLGDSAFVIGSHRGDNLLISSRDPCHAFAFDLVKYLAEGAARGERASQAAATDAVYREFCSRGRNCTSLRVLSDPVFCDADSATERCVFLRASNDSATDSLLRRKVCPVTKFLS